jgi:hypothetical protein
MNNRKHVVQISMHGLLLVVASGRVGGYPESRTEVSDAITRASGLVPLLKFGEYWLEENVHPRVILTLKRRPPHFVYGIDNQLFALPFSSDLIDRISVAEESEQVTVASGVSALDLFCPWDIVVSTECFNNPRSSWDAFSIPDELQSFIDAEIRLQERISVAFLIANQYDAAKSISRFLMNLRNGDYGLQTESHSALVASAFLSLSQMSTWTERDLCDSLEAQGPEGRKISLMVYDALAQQQAYINSNVHSVTEIPNQAVLAALTAARLQGWGPGALLDWIRADSKLPIGTRVLLGLLIGRSSVQGKFVHSLYYQQMIRDELRTISLPLRRLGLLQRNMAVPKPRYAKGLEPQQLGFGLSEANAKEE